MRDKGRLRQALLHSIVAWPFLLIIVVAFTVAGVRALRGPAAHLSPNGCGSPSPVSPASPVAPVVLAGCQLDTQSLEGLDLYSATLSGASMPRVDLRNRDLRAVSAQGAFLPDAHFDKARLDGILLDGATLTRASFRDACLRGATLRGADLRGADFTGADVAGADISGAVGFSEGGVPVGWGSEFGTPRPCSRAP